LRNPCGLDDGRFALAICEASRFGFIGIYAAETLAVRVMDGYQPVVMFSSFIGIECLAFS
jgi:hypothetical protein